MTWNMLVLGHHLAPLRWLPEQRCRPALACCTCLHHYCFLACRSASIATVPVRVARGAVRRSRRAHFEELSLRSPAVTRFVLLLRLLLVDVVRRRAGLDPLCHYRHHRSLAAAKAMR